MIDPELSAYILSFEGPKFTSIKPKNHSEWSEWEDDEHVYWGTGVGREKTTEPKTKKLLHLCRLYDYGFSSNSHKHGLCSCTDDSESDPDSDGYNPTKEELYHVYGQDYK